MQEFQAKFLELVNQQGSMRHDHWQYCHDWSCMPDDVAKQVVENLATTGDAHSHVVLVHEHGGEGLGDEYYKVMQWQDKFYEVPGRYDSYWGSELYWQDIHEVVPVSKTITVYQAIDQA